MKKQKYNKYKKLGIDKINELFRYDENTGLLYNKVNRGTRTQKEKIAGCFNTQGYFQVEIKGIKYLTHILIWMLKHNGKVPDGEIDHINRNRNDNRIKNLRDVTRKINRYNSVVKGKSHYRGVSWIKSSYKWKPRITINGCSKDIGLFDNEIDAAKAWDIEARIVGRDERLMNFPL